MSKIRTRVTVVEDVLPTKADRAELEAAIKEFKEEIEKLNIDESMVWYGAVYRKYSHLILSLLSCNNLIVTFSLTHNPKLWPKLRRQTSALT